VFLRVAGRLARVPARMLHGGSPDLPGQAETLTGSAAELDPRSLSVGEICVSRSHGDRMSVRGGNGIEPWAAGRDTPSLYTHSLPRVGRV